MLVNGLEHTCVIHVIYEDQGYELVSDSDRIKSILKIKMGRENQMMTSQRKYPQRVFAEMTRFSDESGCWYLDENEHCYLVRNKTKIEFGHSDNLIGTVIMTNPGSYGLNKVPGWEEFRLGHGDIQQLAGYGYPDLTMQNIIMVVQEAFNRCGKVMPQGFINILNISNVVCPNGHNAVGYHNELNQLTTKHNIRKHLLESTEVHENLSSLFENSPFVILGFVQKAFEEKAKEIRELSKDYSIKTIMALDQKNWPSHPRRWRIEKELAEKAIAALAAAI